MGIAFFLALIYDCNIEKMNSKIYREREIAHKVVAYFATNDMFVDRLKETAKSHKSLEVKTRAKRIIWQYNQSILEGKLPWLDRTVIGENTKDDVEKVMTKYLYSREDYQNYGGAGWWKSWRNATHDYIWDKIENEGWGKVRCQQFLNKLKEAEINYRKKFPNHAID
jgi:hypothetical protein